MKRFLFITTALVIMVSACERIPYADFTASSTRVEVYEIVDFYNNSSNDADYFEWDFGDGIYSDEVNPSHYYTSAGFYTVTLTAYSNGSAIDRAYLDIDVTTTALDVTVEEIDTHYRVPNASIILYPTLNDWLDESNMVVEGFSDANGVARFENLNPAVYYLDIWEQNHNNWSLGYSNTAYIRTQQLIRNEDNEFVAYVEYVGPNKKTNEMNTQEYKLVKIERRKKEK